MGNCEHRDITYVNVVNQDDYSTTLEFQCRCGVVGTLDVDVEDIEWDESDDWDDLDDDSDDYEDDEDYEDEEDDDEDEDIKSTPRLRR